MRNSSIVQQEHITLGTDHGHAFPGSRAVTPLATASLLALTAIAGATTPPHAVTRAAGTEIAQFTIRQRVIIRVPARRSRRYQAPQELPPAYREKHGPRCIPATGVAGAAISADDSVDFILKGGRRYRAKLEHDCPALDYYSGFYVAPGKDGQVCADRDSIRTRSGGECQIDKFKRLVPRHR